MEHRTPEPWLNIHEAARLARCHVQTLRRRVRLKKVRVYYPNGEGTKPMLFRPSWVGPQEAVSSR